MNAAGASLPELMVRSAIPRSFGNFQTNQRDLPGTPDIVFRDQRLVVFIHGCFWHRHENCDLASFPEGDVHRWLATFNTTVRRDTEALNLLRLDGWRSRIFWECEIYERLDTLIDELGDLLQSARSF